MIYIE